MREYIISVVFIIVAISLAMYGLNLTGYLALPRAEQNRNNLNVKATTTVEKFEKKSNETSVATTTRQTTTSLLATTTSLITSTTAPQMPTAKINEIMYNPSGSDTENEWIEIYNNGTQSINLTNWKLYEGETNHKFILKQGSMILNAGNYAVIVQNSTIFLVRYPNFNGSLIEATFSLSNTGETLSLKDDSSNTIDETTYASSMGASDNNRSLEKKDSEWKESIVDGGTPGLMNSVYYSNATTTIISTIISTTTIQSTTTIVPNSTSTTSASTTSEPTTTITEETTTTIPEIYFDLIPVEDPIVRGNDQTIMTSVMGDEGPIENASVIITVFYFNSSTTKHFSGYTDIEGLYSVSWQIGGNSKIGIYEIVGTASKEGYVTAETNETFEVISA